MTQANTRTKFYLATALWLALFIAGMLSIYAAANGLPYRNVFIQLFTDAALLLR